MTSVAILVFPGTNREQDAALALRDVTGRLPDFIWHKDRMDVSYDLVIIPGGFSYGDYLRCGAMAAHSPAMDSVREFASRGGRIWGICNGFQILVETHMLPGALLRNASLKFVCRRVRLQAAAAKGVLPLGDEITVPVAHGEGNYFVSADDMRALNDNDQVAFRYLDNPNGSSGDIAGVYNKTKTIMGMMPHPENAALPHHANRSGRRLIEGVLNSLGVS